jgi:hypothetical protein
MADTQEATGSNITMKQAVMANIFLFETISLIRRTGESEILK